MGSAEEAGNGEVNQYVTFYVAGEEYGVDILRVREIVGIPFVTRVPNLPAHVKGITNMRGTIVPVVDLRIRLGKPAAAEGEQAAMIVLRSDDGHVGLVVDTIGDILSLSSEALFSADELVLSGRNETISRIGRIDDRSLMVLDPAKLFISPVQEATT